jgi:hypothetical protein
MDDEQPIAQRILEKLDALRSEFQEFIQANKELHRQHFERQQTVSEMLEDNGYKAKERRDH